MNGATTLIAGPPAVIESFLAVRWPEGVYCHRCHSDRAVKAAPHETTRRRLPGVQVYHCGFCLYYFSDLAGTVLERTHLPLCLAAWLLLGGDVAALPVPAGRYRKRVGLRELAARLEDTALAKDWKAALDAAGMTREALQPFIEQWAGEGPAPRGPRARTRKERPA